MDKFTIRGYTTLDKISVSSNMAGPNVVSLGCRGFSSLNNFDLE